MTRRAKCTTSLTLAVLSFAVMSCGGDPLAPNDPFFAKGGGTTPAPLRINEIESSGGSPGDWVEIFNPTSSSVDVSGWQLRDNENNRYSLRAGTRISAGGYLLLDESSFGFGLGAADAARLYDKNGKLVDSFTWTVHATTTYGRCPNGTGAFATTAAATRGSTNACSSGAPLNLPWPTSDAVVTVDATSAFTSNMSGLAHETSGGGAPGVLWASRNGPGTLYRLVFNGSFWTPDAGNGWSAGKTLRYPDGTGNPDAEGVTLASSPAGGIYVATERNNDASATSRNSILRFDASGSASTLVATNEWNLTADLPTVGSNSGLEAITWVPDAYLTASGFFDASKNAPYNPTLYPNHGDGLFFVGVEANGVLYAYALDHLTNAFTRVATISTGMTGVMGLEFDRELSALWATCDDGCSGRSSILSIDVTAGSSTLGRFIVTKTYSRPPSMSNLNNEGFAVASQAECAGGVKPVFWADDAATGGHALRRGTVPCTQ